MWIGKCDQDWVIYDHFFWSIPTNMAWNCFSGENAQNKRDKWWKISAQKQLFRIRAQA